MNWSSATSTPPCSIWKPGARGRSIRTATPAELRTAGQRASAGVSRLTRRTARLHRQPQHRDDSLFGPADHSPRSDLLMYHPAPQAQANSNVEGWAHLKATAAAI
jgi:hypothetical protein